MTVLPAGRSDAARGPEPSDRGVQRGRQREVCVHAVDARRRARHQPDDRRCRRHIRLGLEPADGSSGYGQSASYRSDETSMYHF